MKKIFYFLFVCLHLQAQITFNASPKYLDKNKVKARINTVNNKFWNINGNNFPSYEVPKGKGTHAQFANSLWIGGFDAGGRLHVSANTYRQSGVDFWPGPLDTVNCSAFNLNYTALYNILWKVDCDDINSFVNAYNNGSVTANTYTVPADILNYPAKFGIGNFQKNLEPFYDANGNGLYNPATEGDYPIIKGQQQVLSIFNDNYGAHGEAKAPAMGLEIHEKSYAYYDPNLPDSMQAVNYSTFYHYTIYNRSTTNYSKVFLSDWSDADLGYYLDDYVGTDTINNFAYYYNGDNLDETAFGLIGYGNKPPVVSHAILKTQCTSDGIDNNHNGMVDETGEQFLMDRTTYYYNNTGTVLPQTVYPDSAIHFYRYMSGYWKNQTPFTYGGNAYGGTLTTKYIYPGNPATNTGWTEGTSGNLAGDRKIIFSSGPFDFPAKGKIEWGYAVVFSQDTSQAVNTITQFNSRVQRDVRNVRIYDESHQLSQCSPAVNLTLGAKEIKGFDISASIFPNPAFNRVNINISQSVSKATIKLLDISGRVLIDSEINNDWQTKLDVSLLESGIYYVRVEYNNTTITQKVIKN